MTTHPGADNELRREAALAVLLLRHFHGGESYPSDEADSLWSLAGGALTDLTRAGLFAAGPGAYLVATEAGRSAWRRLSARLAGIRQLDLLSCVNLHVELDDSVSDDGVDARAEASDPRFSPPASAEEAERFGTEDMRFAVLRHLCASREGEDDEDVDERRLTLLLHLADGRLQGESAWFDLGQGAVWLELAERAESAYRPSDVSDDPVVVDDVIRHIYEASVVERRKRTGEPARCLGCGGDAPSTSLWCPPCEDTWVRDLSAPWL